MKYNLRKALVFSALTLMVGGIASPAFAGPPEDSKCNAGRGNLSESTPEDDCDPGNSGDHNNGGD